MHRVAGRAGRAGVSGAMPLPTGSTPAQSLSRAGPARSAWGGLSPGNRVYRRIQQVNSRWLSGLCCALPVSPRLGRRMAPHTSSP
eukprot:1697843-Rhodomonas_salina.2